MAYDLEEQEQIASLKDFWKKHGNLITWLAIIVLGAYAAYNFYTAYERDQALDASVVYEQQKQALKAGDKAKVLRASADLQEKYGRTVYAQMGALAAAKAAFDAGDLPAAKTQLQWVLDNGNDELASVARLRLSGVLLDEKKYDEAAKVLEGEIQPRFKADLSDRKGDILVAQGKIAEARAAYQAALDAMDKQAPGRQLVQIKLDAIGGAPAAAKAAA